MRSAKILMKFTFGLLPCAPNVKSIETFASKFIYGIGESLGRNTIFKVENRSDGALIVREIFKSKW